MVVYCSCLFVISYLLIQTVVCENIRYNETENEYTYESKVLSRRKRFLIFPEGSSLQLVFCVQTSAIITIGDIFLYGNTAALAWNLPSDPKIFELFKEYEKTPLRRSDSKTIAYVDDTGKVLSRVPYTRKTIVNPAFAKRSIEDGEMKFKKRLKHKIDKKKMHEKHKNRDYLKKDHLDDSSIEFHRSNRLEILVKLEKLFTALGRDGRQCVLYKLCESAQRSVEQGTFLNEFLRVVFTLPKGRAFDDEEYREYDKAHTATEDCSRLYPGCDDFNVPVQFSQF